jgi:hypothetical protein
MSVRTTALLWAQRVIARKDAPAHLILEIAVSAELSVAQEAFRRIARMAHPDLHRTTLTPEELELVTTAYARAAAAYQEIRTQRRSSARMRPIRSVGSDPALVPSSPGIPTPSAPIKPAQAMTPRALLHYRKAELGLRRGDLSGAVQELKMAIASDPTSQFLRSALAEVESEVGKKT